jgi:hypothetical protein
VPGAIPQDLAIYHITHVTNLVGILRDGCLWSDSQRVARQTTNIGYTHIKERRLRRAVPVAALGVLADYVPFNFCHRSVMLYALRGGHEDYAGGQDQVVHIVSSVQRAVALNRPWAFTDRHADLGYAQYFDSLAKLNEVDWGVMPLTFWAGSDDTREKRQAEFLVHQMFSWSAVQCIGVQNDAVAATVRSLLGNAAVPVAVQPDWYY